jgi:hypothetical protein
MDTKLTLKLNKKVIERAKKYALKENTSLSRLVEDYLDVLSEPLEAESELTPLVKRLSGVARVPKNYDSKKDYSKYLEEKYK